MASLNMRQPLLVLSPDLGEKLLNMCAVGFFVRKLVHAALRAKRESLLVRIDMDKCDEYPYDAVATLYVGNSPAELYEGTYPLVMILFDPVTQNILAKCHVRNGKWLFRRSVRIMLEDRTDLWTSVFQSVCTRWQKRHCPAIPSPDNLS